MDPWGTPVVMGAAVEVTPFMYTVWVRFVKYEENYLSADSAMFSCANLLRIRL